MWEPQSFESYLETRLTDERGKVKGSEKYAQYVEARRRLVDEILDEIKARQSTLTDHGARHIANVLNNAWSLIEKKAASLTATDLYSLAVAILFHDVGNLFDRKNHQQEISDIYDYVRPPKADTRQEKLVITGIVAAHCGEAPDKSNDTLKFLEPSHIDGRQVNMREVAAVLRFADELAEGRQRTSRFMQDVFGYDAKSQIYHEYANITHVSIQGDSQRIALTYHFPCDEASLHGVLISDLLAFTYKRILKMNQERSYARHYCSLLEPFKQISVAMTFWHRERVLKLGLESIVLSDLVVPGDIAKQVSDYNPAYNIPNVLKLILEATNSRTNASDEIGIGTSNAS